MDPHSFILYKGLLYGELWNILTNKGRICCIEPKNGSLLWERKLNTFSSSGLLLTDKVLCIATDSYCYLFDRITGKKIKRIEYEFFEGPLLWWPESNEILTIDIHGNLIALSLTDGTVSRTFKFIEGKLLKMTRFFEGNKTEHSFRNPTVFTRYNDYLLIGWLEHKLLTFDLSTWSVVKPYNINPFSKALINNNIAFMQTKHDNFEGYKFGAINLEFGDLQWQVNLPFSRGNATWSPHPYILDDQLIWIRTAGGPFYALSHQSGQMRFIFDEQAASKYVSQLEKEAQPIEHFFKFQSKFYVQLADQLYSLSF